MDAFLLITILITIAYFGFIFLAALWFDVSLREKNPNFLPFKWGYYVAVLGMTGSLIKIFLEFLEGHRANYIIIILLVVFALNSFLMFRRIRISWVLGTILSLNPILWFINYFYIKRRYSELISFSEFEEQIDFKISDFKYKDFLLFFIGVFFVLLGLKDLINGQRLSIEDSAVVAIGIALLYSSTVKKRLENSKD